MFPTKFLEMNGIVGDLGEMKIPLNPNTKSVKQRPYWLNPWCKEKVKTKRDQMLDACIIEPVEESECRMNYTNLIGWTPFLQVYLQEAAIPMEYVVPNLRIVVITEITDVGAIKERLSQLL